MLRLAGCSSGRRDCARGVGLRERGGSRAGLCSSCAGRAILSECRVFVRAHHAFLSECPVFDHACCLPPVRQTGRLAICCVSIPPWVVIAGSAFSNRQCDYRGWLVHFGLARFLAAIPTEDAENGVGGEAKCVLCEHIGFAVFSAGSTLGLRAPDCAKETRLPGLSSFDSRRGCVSRGEGHSGMTET